VELSITRTFGRWQVQPLDLSSPRDVGRSSVLVEALAARLALRKVRVHFGCPIERINIHNGKVAGVATGAGERRAAAVIVTCDPWQTVNQLLPAGAVPQTRRWLRDLRAAAAPAITHQLADPPDELVTEAVRLTAAGIPTVTYLRRQEDTGVRTDHDFTKTRPRPSYGLAWSGFTSWLRRPHVTTEIDGLYAASPSSPAGPGASQVVLSAALAAYGCHDYLGAPIARR
jgi:2-polyprenyl-6-methoxyphenol hydroxylase-like FAD-dependent oxidoreductase